MVLETINKPLPFDIKIKLDKYNKTLQLIIDSINNFEKIFKEEIEKKSQNDEYLKKLKQYNNTIEILNEYSKEYDRIFELYNKESKMKLKYFKYKMKYLKLKNLN